ncbi:DedA family [Fagus crenata]
MASKTFPMAVLMAHGHGSLSHTPTSTSTSSGKSFTRRPMKHFSCLSVNHRLFAKDNNGHLLVSHFFSSSTSRIRSIQQDNAENYEEARSQDIVDDEVLGNGNKGHDPGSSFLAKVAIVLGIAATATVISICLKQPVLGSSLGIQFLAEGSSSSGMAAAPVGFTFKAFGYKVLLPEFAPGWIYFWLLMAAGCGLFISEEALNIWVGITLARMLSLDGTWQSFAESFSRNAPYIISTVLWVYWGVCISDLIPFYLGKLFRQSGASDDVCSRLGIGNEKTLNITRMVQKHGNLTGFVERFSLGVRNPTAFLAGAMGISPECFFAGVCCGGLITLPLQLGIGFLLREHPVYALATVATAVGIWTVFPYAVAASTTLFLFLRRRYYS